MLTVEQIVAILPKCRTLEGAALLEALSPQDLANVCNGIGAAWMDGVSFCGVTLSDVFNHAFAWAVPASIIHDVRYAIGGTEEERRAADDEFLRNLLRLAGWWRWWRRGLARRMHRLLRAFGEGAWSDGLKD